MNPLLLGLAISLGAPTIKERPKEETALLGDWKLVEWLDRGKPRELLANMGVEFLPDGKRMWRDGPGEPENRQYKLYPKTSPAQIDLIRDDLGPVPAVYPAIFKVEGDKLIIAIGDSNAERPSRFEGPGIYMRMTFTRIKKKD